MDWITDKEHIQRRYKKLRPALLILLVGIFLMILPAEEEPPQETQVLLPAQEPDLEEELANILSNVVGAGKVEVLLTQSQGEETIYQTDDDLSSNDRRKDTVLITNANREETGLIKQMNPPVYLGAIVLCQGADNAAVQLSIVKAVMSVTGLTSDRITVLKMN